MLARSANTIQYQHKQKDGTRVYIKKSNAALIKALAQKEYDQKILKTIDAEERRIRKFLNKYNPNSLLEVYDSMPEQKGIFVTKYELTDAKTVNVDSTGATEQRVYAKMWEESKNNLGRIEPDEQLKELGLITEKGEYVRSKSEKIIADTLTKNNINYVYELPLRLKGYGTVKPDFTVLNKRTRHEYVWEHFGMMDDSIYVKNAIKKIEQYGKSGYVQGRNFIATFESKEAPLNTVTINRVIQDFFQ